MSDTSKKYLRKVNTIEITSTNSIIEVRPSYFKKEEIHVLISGDGGKYYLNPYDTGFEKESLEIKITIAYIGGLDSKGKRVDTRTKDQKIAIENSIKEAIYWARRERLDLESLQIICLNIDPKILNEYLHLLKSEGYKRKSSY